MIIALIIDVKISLLHFLFLSLLYSVKSKWKMTTSFVLFDKEVEKIIQKIVLKLSSKVSNLNSWPLPILV